MYKQFSAKLLILNGFRNEETWGAKKLLEKREGSNWSIAMKCLPVSASLISFLSCFFATSVFFLSNTAEASWQVASPRSAVPSDPFFQSGVQNGKIYLPSANSDAFTGAQFGHMGRPAGVYAISVSGSLKENIERIMDRYHWRVLWKVPYDYNFDGRITGNSLPDVIKKLLQPFPLQAKLYMSNHIMTVTPRKEEV